MIDKDRLVTTLCDLIKIDSPSGDESAIGQYLIDQLEKLGVSASFDYHGNVIGRSDIGEGNPLLLSAHMDTVEPGRGIAPKIDGAFLVSDDSTILGGDCKAGIASILEAITSLREDTAPHLSFEVAFTRQEEIGLVGARNLDYSTITAKEAIVFDGEGPVTQITSSSPTHVGFEINIKGKAAHAGVEPEKGVSAIRIASELITLLPQGRIDEETTFNIGVVNGGSVTNAVPENAVIRGEFRSHNPITLNGIKDILQNSISQVSNVFPEAIIDVNQNTHFERYNLTGDESSVKRVTKVFESLGLEYNFKPSGGGTDANILIAHGIDSAIVGMADHNAHTVREYVVIDELLDVARVCDQILRL